jgi:hypothetical protein
MTGGAEGALENEPRKEDHLSREKLMDRARDELFSHVHRCGVLQAAEEDQRHWMDETIDYIGERYPDLTDADLQSLHEIGTRFCKPAIAHGAGNTAKSMEDVPVA